MIWLVLAALEICKHTAQRGGLERDGLAGLFLNKAAEGADPVAQLRLRYHIAAELVTENEEIICVFAHALDLRVGQRRQRLIFGHGEDMHTAVFKAVARAGEGLAGLPYLRGELVRRAVGRDIGARREIAGVGHDENTPPARIIDRADNEKHQAQYRAEYAVTGAKKVILHTRERKQAILRVLHCYFKRLHLFLRAG